MKINAATWDQQLPIWRQRRRIIWIAIAVAFLVAYFHRSVIGVVSDSLMRDFSMNRATDLGLLASIYFWTYAALQIPAGILADRFGPRRVISLALLASAAGTMLFACASTLPILYAGRFLTTLGVGVIFISMIKIQADWFRLREFATMSGLIVLIGNSGSLLSATPMAFVVDGWGWRSAFFLIALYSASMAAVCWVVIRNRPEDLGLPSVAEIESYEGNLPPPRRSNDISTKACLKTVLLNRATWPPVFSSTFLYGSYMAILGVWGIPYLMQIYGLSRVEASNYILVMIFGNMLGSPLTGYVSDQIRSRRLPFVFDTLILLSALLLLASWNGARPPSFALYPICFAMGVGVSGITLGTACIKEISPPQATGLATGLVNSGPFLGAALMQPLFGWMLDMHWEGAMEQGLKIYPQNAYASAFWLCIGVVSIGLLFTCLIRETRCCMIYRDN